MAHFPVFLDLSTKKCMIFGGGNVALRKIETLLKYDAQIEVITREAVKEITSLLPISKVHLEELTPESMADWIEKADLVIAATSSRSLNHEIAMYCQQKNVLVNVIDAPEECTFLFPSIVKKGDISIGINTGAKSPIVSKQVRQDIEKAIPDYYAAIADQLGEVRNYVKMHISEEKERRRILKTVAAQAFLKERILTVDELTQIYGII